VSVRDGDRVAALVRARPTGVLKPWFETQFKTPAAARQRLALSIGSQKKLLGAAAACDPRTGRGSGRAAGRLPLNRQADDAMCRESLSRRLGCCLLPWGSTE
jgi:hypothetical protein